MKKYFEIECADNGWIVREEGENEKFPNEITALVEFDWDNYESLSDYIGKTIIKPLRYELDEEIGELDDDCIGYSVNVEIKPITKTTVKFKQS